MQVEVTKSEGLTRQFAVTVAAREIDEKVNTRLGELAQTVKMPGFRPGKVPVALVKKQYGRSVIGEVLERAISESSAKALTDNKLRPAVQPKVTITDFDEGKDLRYTMTVEVLPEIKQPDFGAIKLDRLVVKVDDKMVDETLARIAKEQRVYAKTDEDRAATAEDALLVDFTGKIDGREFPGGAAKDFQLELLSKNFIPGFVEQLIGVKAGQSLSIKVKFPDDYGSQELAGKDATFDVVVKELRAGKPMEVNDEMAKGVGLENVEAMRAAIRERLGSEYGAISRVRLKRSLLDALAEVADFDLPAGMVAGEFGEIWRSVSGEAPDHGEHAGHGHEGHDHAGHDHAGHDHGAHDHGHHHHDEGPDLIAQQRFKHFLDESGKTVEQLKDEYRAIADRRVRLGLLLAEIGTANNIKVADEEINRTIINEARRFPGQERQVIEYYQNNPPAREQLRGPLFEDKVVDFILELAKVTEKPVTADELMADPDAEEAEGGAKADAGTTKKSAAKKSKG